MTGVYNEIGSSPVVTRIYILRVLSVSDMSIH